MNKKNPWETEEGKAIWKSKSQYYNWLRGALRRLWSDYPLRQEWKKRQMRKVTDKEREDKVFHRQTKNVGQCHYCNEWFPASKLEVDHKNPSDGCKSKEEAEKFLWYCGGQTGDKWVLACKPCHKIVTYAERHNITFEQAVTEKRVIELSKLSLKKQNELLTKHNMPCNNANVRKESFRKLIEANKL